MIVKMNTLINYKRVSRMKNKKINKSKRKQLKKLLEDQLKDNEFEMID